MSNKLRPQQQIFLNAILEGNKAPTAYRKAGYVTERNGVELPWLKEKAYQVLLTPSMQSALTLARTKQEERKQVTADWVQDKLILVYDDALLANDRPNILKALDLIGKTCDAFTENLHVSTDQRREYTEREREQMKELSSLLLERKSLPILDVEANESSDEEG